MEQKSKKSNSNNNNYHSNGNSYSPAPVIATELAKLDLREHFQPGDTVYVYESPACHSEWFKARYATVLTVTRFFITVQYEKREQTIGCSYRRGVWTESFDRLDFYVNSIVKKVSKTKIKRCS